MGFFKDVKTMLEDMELRLKEVIGDFENGTSIEKTKSNLQQLLDEATLWKIELEDDPDMIALLNNIIVKIKTARIEVYNYSANNINNTGI